MSIKVTITECYGEYRNFSRSARTDDVDEAISRVVKRIYGEAMEFFPILALSSCHVRYGHIKRPGGALLTPGRLRVKCQAAGYTLQVFVAGYAHPSGDDVTHVGSIAEAKRQVLRWHEEAQEVGAAYDYTEALLWKGRLDDVTDLCPDLQLITGPRGGVSHGPC